MYYGTTQLATSFSPGREPWKLRALKALLFFIPRANPDIEKLYSNVRQWALEVDDDGWPQREIGLDESGSPLFSTPDNRNTGFWTDMAARQFQRGELSELSAQDFEIMWSKNQSAAVVSPNKLLERTRER